MQYSRNLALRVLHNLPRERRGVRSILGALFGRLVVAGRSEREAFFVASRFIAIIVIIAIKTPLRLRTDRVEDEITPMGRWGWREGLL